jgi:hypothetical protein
LSATATAATFAGQGQTPWPSSSLLLLPSSASHDAEAEAVGVRGEQQQQVHCPPVGLYIIIRFIIIIIISFLGSLFSMCVVKLLIIHFSHYKLAKRGLFFTKNSHHFNRFRVASTLD